MSFLEVSKENLQLIANESNSFSEMLNRLNLKITSGNYRFLRRKIREFNIDLTNINYSRLSTNNGRGTNLGEIGFVESKSNAELFIENSTSYTETVKRRIQKYKLIPYKCKKCGIEDEWQNEKITLILDHINGISNDHRLENLRFLCPNCNSQTNTFAGRNNLRLKQICPVCKSPFQGIGTRCKSCYYDASTFKIEKEELSELLAKYKTYSVVAKKLGVCGATVRKYCDKFGIKRPLG